MKPVSTYHSSVTKPHQLLYHPTAISGNCMFGVHFIGAGMYEYKAEAKKCILFGVLFPVLLPLSLIHLLSGQLQVFNAIKNVHHQTMNLLPMYMNTTFFHCIQLRLDHQPGISIKTRSQGSGKGRSFEEKCCPCIQNFELSNTATITKSWAIF